MSYSDAEAAQAIVYWLAGMPQKTIGVRLKRNPAPSLVSLAINEFTRKYATNLPPGLPPLAYGYSEKKDEYMAQIAFQVDRRKFAANALNNWCRAQQTKPRLRLAASWVRVA